MGRDRWRHGLDWEQVEYSGYASHGYMNAHSAKDEIHDIVETCVCGSHRTD